MVVNFLNKEQFYTILCPIGLTTLNKIPWSPPLLEKEERNAVYKVIKSNWLTQGPITFSLEKKLCQYFGVKHAVVISNGTSALICALLAHGIGRGDEVLVPSFTFVASVNSILAVGAKPVLVDSNSKTFNTEPTFMKNKISKKTKAIMPVDVAGMSVDINDFRNFANKHNLILIEDAAEGIGGKYNKRKIGSFGHTTIISFHMAKVVPGIEGGCILTNDEKIAKLARATRSHGEFGRYNSKIFGLNFRISDIHSAIIISQLRKINRFLKHRNKLASIYKDELKYCEFQSIPSFVTMHPYMLFGILVSKKKRNKLNIHLNKKGIDTRICWPPVHKQPYHSKIFNKRLVGAELIYSRIINLPMGNGLTENQVSRIIENVNQGMKALMV